jgi:protein KTI12
LQRNLTKNSIVIVDALNYIKGFRYQMYCVAREAGVRVATVRET